MGGVVGGIEVASTTCPSDGAAGAPQPAARHRAAKPTGDNKLRVAVVGDSLASGLGYLERVLKPSFVEVYRQGRISTGLARPDYFDWPAALSEIVDRPTRT